MVKENLRILKYLKVTVAKGTFIQKKRSWWCWIFQVVFERQKKKKPKVVATDGAKPEIKNFYS